jgi:hypothetical protein
MDTDGRMEETTASFNRSRTTRECFVERDGYIVVRLVRGPERRRDISRMFGSPWNRDRPGCKLQAEEADSEKDPERLQPIDPLELLPLSTRPCLIADRHFVDSVPSTQKLPGGFRLNAESVR